MAKAKRRRGGTSMSARGLVRVQVWFEPADLALVSDQAKAEKRPLANYVRFHLLELVRRQKLTA